MVNWKEISEEMKQQRDQYALEGNELKKKIENVIKELKKELEPRERNPFYKQDNCQGRVLRTWCNTIRLVIDKLENVLKSDGKGNEKDDPEIFMIQKVIWSDKYDNGQCEKCIHSILPKENNFTYCGKCKHKGIEHYTSCKINKCFRIECDFKQEKA